MIDRFEVVTDNSGRINYYAPEGQDDFIITPAAMIQIMDEGDTIPFRGVDYVLHESGSMVHPEVEVPSFVTIQTGAILREGVKFVPPGDDDSDGEIIIGAGSRVQGTEIHGGVIVNNRALILAKRIGKSAWIGPYARVREGVSIGENVIVGEAAKIDRDSSIGPGAVIEFGAQLGYKTVMDEGSRVVPNAKVGESTGVRNRGLNQDGVYIPRGTVYPFGQT